MKNLNYSENPDTGKSHYKPILEAARITSLNPELFNLTMSAKSQPLLEAVKAHIAENVDPMTEEYYKHDCYCHL